MALYANFETGEDSSYYSNSATRQICQTFIPSADCVLTSVQVYVFRTGAPGDVRVAIETTATGKPTGTEVDATVVDGDQWGLAVGNRDWEVIAMTGGQTLTGGVTYAVVIGPGDAFDNDNRPEWRGDLSAAGFADGSFGYANDGATWTMLTDDDMYFRIYGNAVSSGVAGSVLPIVAMRGLI